MINIFLAMLGSICILAAIVAIMTFANSGPRDMEDGGL